MQIKKKKLVATYVSNVPTGLASLSIDTKRKHYVAPKRVLVDNKYTYETELDLEVGDRVILSSSKKHLSVDTTWEGTVTSLDSIYTGPCKSIISKL